MLNVECSIEHRKLSIEHSLEMRGTLHGCREHHWRTQNIEMRWPLGFSMSLCAGRVVATLVLLAVWILSDVVSAQVPIPPQQVPLPPPLVPAPSPLPKELPKPEPPVPGILPPAPVPERRGPIPTVKVFVREIRVLGSTVFTAKELAQVTDPYRDREITSEDIEALRLAMTMLYVKHEI